VAIVYTVALLAITTFSFGCLDSDQMCRSDLTASSHWTVHKIAGGLMELAWTWRHHALVLPRLLCGVAGKISYANRPSFAICPTSLPRLSVLILLSFKNPQPQPLVTLHASELLLAFVGRIMGYPPCALCCMSRSLKTMGLNVAHDTCTMRLPPTLTHDDRATDCLSSAWRH
jgi:hypothetical protein